MSDHDKDGLIAQFQSITGIEDAERATFFLEASNWNVDLAISSFFDDAEPPLGVESQAVNPPSQDAEESVGASGSDERSKPATVGGGKVFFALRCREGERGVTHSLSPLSSN